MKLFRFLLSFAAACGGVIPASAAAAAGATAPAPETSAAREITDLRRELARHDRIYHRESAAEISDAEYDRLRQRLAELERDRTVAASSVETAAVIGDDRTGRFPTRGHRERMLSLDKVYAEPDLRAFHRRVTTALGRGDVAYVIEPKYDGLALSLTYERGELVRALTRGNGREGEEVTANALRIVGLPRKLAGGLVPDVMEVRGEVYVPLATFSEVNAAREAAGEARFATPRNLAAGTLRQADADAVAQRGLRFVAFGVGACEPAAVLPETQRAWPARFQAWGFSAIAETWTARGLDELVRAVAACGRTRGVLPFPTDGAVVKVDALAAQRELGASETAPRWAVAYKFAPEQVETRLLAIRFQVGRTGVLTPVAELVPVSLGGTKIARATLHNLSEITRRDLRIGDTVVLEKAGDVIPAIAGVNRSLRPAEAPPFPRPIACPSCYARVGPGDSDGSIRCPNRECPAQIRRRLEHFASRAAVEIAGLGPVMIETLVAEGWVKEVADLYRLSRAELLTLGHDHAKSVDRLLAAIRQSKQTEVWRVIHGLGLPQVGAAKAKELARQYGTLVAFAEHGASRVPALAEAHYQMLVADLIALGVGSAPPPVEAKWAGKTFALTGTLPTLSRAQVTAKIEAMGGKVSGSVSRNTHYVVAGDDPGTKLERAHKLDLPVIDEAELRRMLDEP